MDISLSDVLTFLRLILDILVVWALIYGAFRLVRNNSRTIQILKGLLVIMIVKVLAVWIGLNTLSYLIDLFLNWGIVAILILFQPEIRGMLEKVGKTTAILPNEFQISQYTNMINELVDACTDMSNSKTGALITIEQSNSLNDYIQSGIRMDSQVSRELLGTIFQYGTPMHDGAVIIQGTQIACAAAYFPPTTKDLPSKYGARHRAAVGISEITDSITIIVSEETGNISVAYRGQLTQYPPEGLKRYLTNRLIQVDEQETPSILQPVIKTAKSFGLSMSKKSDGIVRIDERIKPIEVVDLLEKKQGGK